MFVNLTPHTLNIIRDGGEDIIIPPSGTVARCAVNRRQIGTIDGVPINATEFGAVEGLPDPAPGTYYIVSALVAQAVRGREDVLITDDAVRDSSGRIVGCRAFARV